jgi:hypothetical protein
VQHLLQLTLCQVYFDCSGPQQDCELLRSCPALSVQAAVLFAVAARHTGMALSGWLLNRFLRSAQGLGRLQDSAFGDLIVPIIVLLLCLVSLGIGIGKVVNNASGVRFCILHPWDESSHAARLFVAPVRRFYRSTSCWALRLPAQSS